VEKENMIPSGEHELIFATDNSIPLEGAEKLAQFIAAFAKA